MIKSVDETEPSLNVDGTINIPSGSSYLLRLYSNHGIRVRMVHKNHSQKIPTVRELIERLAKKHEKLMQEEAERTRDEKRKSSSSTPTVPYSSADLGYSEVNRQGGDISGSDLVCFDREKEKNRLKEYDRQLSGRNNSRRSVSLEKVNYENDREELRPIKNTFPTAKSNQGRPNGLRGNFIRTDQLLNPKNNVSFQTLAREPEDLIAMGTIWSPNVQQRGTAIPASTKSQTLPSQYNSLTTQTIRKGPNGTASRTLLGNQNLNTARKEAEPKYNDPLSGAPASFQQRLMELSSLESETISMELKNSFSKEVMKEASLMLKKLLPKRGTKATQQGKRC